LRMGAVDSLALLAGQLDLAARLERDRRALTLQREDVAVLVFGLEAIVGRHPPQQVLDAAGAGVGDSGRIGGTDYHLLVLGADTPIRARLAALLEVADQVVFLLKQLTHESNP